MGTGGTLTGVGRFLKSRNSSIRIVGVDIEGSILLEIWKNKGRIPDGAFPKTYKVEGIGEDFLPSTTDLSQVDEIVRVNDRESFVMATRPPGGIFAAALRVLPWRCGSIAANCLQTAAVVIFRIQARATFPNSMTTNGCVRMASWSLSSARLPWVIFCFPSLVRNYLLPGSKMTPAKS
jgi:hypothetical protein